jgi:hypothetical protein
MRNDEMERGIHSNAFKDSDFFSTKGASHTSLGHRPDPYTQIAGAGTASLERNENS